MSVTSERRSQRPAGLDATTVAEAFQLTAAAHGERLALRTRGDEFSMSWADYAGKVRSLAEGRRRRSDELPPIALEAPPPGDRAEQPAGEVGVPERVIEHSRSLGRIGPQPGEQLWSTA